MRRKISWLLIKLANKIRGEEYYDFGEEIKGMLTWRGLLMVHTKHSLYSSRNGDKWIKVIKKQK